MNVARAVQYEREWAERKKGRRNVKSEERESEKNGKFYVKDMASRDLLLQFFFFSPMKIKRS